MKRLVILLYVIVMTGCGGSTRYPIEDAWESESFYREQIQAVDARIQTNTATESMLYKKIYASQQLDWSVDVTRELEKLLILEGLNKELYQFASDYYLHIQQYDKLNQLVDRWLRIHEPTSEDLTLKIQALNGLGEKLATRSLLWSLTSSNSTSGLVFAAKNYLDEGDTTLAMYAFSKLARVHPTDSSLLEDYIPLLLNKGYPEKARELLVYQKPFIKGYHGKSVLAETLFQMGEVDQAFSIMKAFNNQEAYLTMAGWYQELNAWDSAVYFSDRLIALDSSRVSLLKKADIMEDRGWLETALENLEAIIARNPTDSVAILKAELVEGKIASLRRLREAKRKIPVLNITPKKSTENE